MPKIDTTVGNLVAMIESGELRLPEIQRGYIWPGTRVRDLLDSLYREYPSGTILVWETDQEMPSRDLAVSQDESPFRGHKLLLDGQQRLTSLSAILRGEPVRVKEKVKPIDVLFNLDHPGGPPVEITEVENDAAGLEDSTDLDEEESGLTLPEQLQRRTFVVASKTLLADPRWIRVSDAFNAQVGDTQLLRRLVKSLDDPLYDPLYDKYSSRLQKLRKIRDYPYVMHVLDKGHTYEEVAEIFVRVNSLGMKLRGSDLALAQITSRWQDSLQLFEAFQEECEESWYTLDMRVIVRALIVFTTGQSRFHTAGTTPVRRLKEGWEEAKQGLRFSINLLKSNAGIEDESLLSSLLFIVSVGYFAKQRGYRLTAAEESQLRRWLYIANARGHYSASSETILDADLKLMREGATARQLLDALERDNVRLRIEPSDLEGRGQQSALFSMAYLALQARGAKDWETALGLSLTHQGRYHYIQHHHIFPKALLKGRYEKSQINEIANMAFITGRTNRRIGARATADYLAEVLEREGSQSLEAHSIPTDPALWTVDAYPDFLVWRRAALARAINDFIYREDVAATEPGVQEILAAGESDGVEFKASARWDYRQQTFNKVLEAVVVKTLAGFLNSNGGALLLGVDDQGHVVGLEADYCTLSGRPDRDGYQQFLVNLVSGSLGKEVSAACVSFLFSVVGSQEICLIRVKASSRPVYVRDGQQTQLYVRSGNTTQQLNSQQTVEYVRAHWPAGTASS